MKFVTYFSTITKHKRNVIMKKWIIGAYAILVLAALCLVFALTPSNQPDDPTQPPATVPTQPTLAPTQPVYKGEIRLYQCDADLAEKWAVLAERYTLLTGISVSIITPEGDCDDSLPQYMGSEDAPTIFCLHHSHDLEQWKNHCLDLSGSIIANALQQDIFALRDGEKILGVAGNVESYGIIYNSKLLAAAGYTAEDITDFDSLKTVVSNITANKKKLGFSAFASPDLKNTDHQGLLCLLAGLSKDSAVLREFWDLYSSNNVRSGAALTQSSRNDTLADFQNGKAVFALGGTWDYEHLSKIEDYFLGILPVYTSADQENLGLHHASTGYWCVNSQAGDLDRAVSLDFLGWLVTAEEGAVAPVDELQLLTPYKDTKYAGNPLEQLVLRAMENSTNIHWNSCDDLSPQVLKKFGNALSAYTKNPTDKNWEEVTKLKEDE